MKVKSSVVLTQALALIESGAQSYACAAIQDVEVQMRWDAGGENVISKAQKVFNAFKPERLAKNPNAAIMEWWPKGDVARIEALTQAIAAAKKGND
jgi:hypothetical protein